ncbi:MAG: hypothetical protein WC101_04420 [Candidatus Gracilibacteria bacterium]
MNVKLAIATGAAVLGAAGGLYKQETSHDGVKPLSLVQQGLDDVRGFQDHMPVFEGAPEEVEQKVNAALHVAMRQCLAGGRMDAPGYLAKKAEWPISVQLQVRACCAKVVDRDDVYRFQFAIGERTFDTREGQVFFQKDIRCSSAAIVRPQKEESIDTSKNESEK